jgi:hypothetical protein
VTTPTPNPTESASTDEQANATSPEQVWRQAVADTRKADSTMLDVQLITDVEGFERITSGAGYVEMLDGYGDITWTDDLGQTREVITANGHFLELDGTWFTIERSPSSPTAVAFDPLAGLAEAQDVVEVGPEDVAGIPTTRFDADLDAKRGIDVMGFSEEERTVFGDQGEASLIATIWIDADGRIVRILREYSASSFDGDPIRATNLFLLDAIGEAAPIEVPETADAVPAPV